MLKVLGEILFWFFLCYGILNFCLMIIDLLKPSIPYKCVIAVLKDEEDDTKLFFVRRWAEKIKFKNGYPDIVIVDKEKYNRITENKE